MIFSLGALAHGKGGWLLGRISLTEESCRPRDFRTRAAAAARTVSSKRTADSSRNPRIPILGLVMISTAPFSRARIAVSVLGPVRPEQMTTGRGFSLISFRKKV